MTDSSEENSEANSASSQASADEAPKVSKTAKRGPGRPADTPAQKAAKAAAKAAQPPPPPPRPRRPPTRVELAQRRKDQEHDKAIRWSGLRPVKPTSFVDPEPSQTKGKRKKEDWEVDEPRPAKKRWHPISKGRPIGSRTGANDPVAPEGEGPSDDGPGDEEAEQSLSYEEQSWKDHAKSVDNRYLGLQKLYRDRGKEVEQLKKENAELQKALRRETIRVPTRAQLEEDLASSQADCLYWIEKYRGVQPKTARRPPDQEALPQNDDEGSESESESLQSSLQQNRRGRKLAAIKLEQDSSRERLPPGEAPSLRRATSPFGETGAATPYGGTISSRASESPIDDDVDGRGVPQEDYGPPNDQEQGYEGLQEDKDLGIHDLGLGDLLGLDDSQGDDDQLGGGSQRESHQREEEIDDFQSQSPGNAPHALRDDSGNIQYSEDEPEEEEERSLRPPALYADSDKDASPPAVPTKDTTAVVFESAPAASSASDKEPGEISEPQY
ncbi:hypothetical protein MMC10_002173 [Thelotrema lepadinum]|nr:hypothetical protein [Thelotrema lepadinum]